MRPLGLSERIRWEEPGACPFGLCFRARAGAIEEAPLPFATWPYRPPYLPPGATLPIVTPRGSRLEPRVFLRERPIAARATSGLHRGAKRSVTAVSIQSPHGLQSPALRWFADHGLLSVQRGSDYLLEWCGTTAAKDGPSTSGRYLSASAGDRSAIAAGRAQRKPRSMPLPCEIPPRPAR